MGSMVAEEPVGIKLSQQVAYKVSWKTLLSSVVDGVENAVKASHGDMFSAGKALGSILEAAGAFKSDIPVETRALEIIVLSFALSVQHTAAAYPGRSEELKAAMKAAIEQCKEETQKGTAQLPYDFFESPHTARIYCDMRTAYLDRVFSDVDALSKKEVERFRLDQAFRAAVWELWHTKFGAFEELSKTLNGASAELKDFDRQWINYRRQLISEFYVKPIFGQEESLVSLSSLYIPLRCSWAAKEEELPSSFEVPKDKTESKFLCVDRLENQLFDWLDNDDPDDWLRLVGGGPGSGKSTTARAFAAKVAERIDVQPLFIPLQRLDTQVKLRDAINSYFVLRTGSPFVTEPLDRRFIESAPRLLLVFDGLDEIARPGESANAIARDMIDRIRSLYSELTGDGKSRHKVLVTGRTVSFEVARKAADKKGNEALEVVNYAPTFNLRAVASSEEQSLLDLDQRPQWWEKYSSVLGRASKLPEAFSDERLNSITSEPLLCYLFALSGYLEENAKEAAGNRNKIYQRLLEDVWRRGWGGGRAGPGQQLDQSDFDRLFETMALAAWHGGDERLATYDRFERALVIMNTSGIFEEFKRNEGGDISNLAVNFYLKHADSSGKGFEFTHKSFGEYLAARAIFRAADGVIKLAEFREELAAGEWIKAVSTGVLSTEILAFLRDEARLRTDECVKNCLDAKSKLEKVFNFVQRNGFPPHQGMDVSWRDAENAQRHAEGLLLAVINALAGAISESEGSPCLVKVAWPHEFSLGELIHRQRRVRNQDIPVQLIFSYMLIEDQNLLGVEMINFDFSNSTFISCRMFRSIMAGINFKGSSLTGVSFVHAILSRANFEFASIENFEIARSFMEGVTFNGTKFNDGRLEYCVLDESEFIEAQFNNVKATESSLQNISLEDEQRSAIEISTGEASFIEKSDIRRTISPKKNRLKKVKARS